MEMDLDISDEDYVIAMVKQSFPTDPFESRAWMLTAKSLYPANFGVQFQAYRIQKELQANIKGAAKCFSDLIGKFEEKEQLWKEIEAITKALRAEDDDTNRSTEFLCEMFKHMSTDVQHHLLVLTANHCEDTMEHCRLLLLLLQRFPVAISSYASNLVDTLCSAERHCYNTAINNPCRKILVCDLLPLLANEQDLNLDITEKQYYNVLVKAIQFYLYSMGFMQLEEQEDLKIEGAWQKLFTIVEFIGNQLGWDPTIGFSNTNWSKEGFWRKLLAYHRQVPPNFDEKQSCFTIFIFFCYCLDEYNFSTTPECSPGQLPITHVLVEAFLDPTLPVPPVEPKFKRRKNDAAPHPHISVEKPEMKQMINNFFMVVNCFEFIYSTERLKREFKKFCDCLKIDAYLNGFIIDYMVYKGKFDELIAFFEKSNCQVVSKNIRTAHVSYITKNYSACFEQILSILPLLSIRNKGNLSTSLVIGGVRRHLHFLPLTHFAVLQYCVKLLLRCITENLSSTNYNEYAIGSALVLTQLDWPQEDEFVPPIMEKIKLHGSFHFPLFQNYIINIELLEELTYLWTPQGGQITLDIIPHLGQRRIGTRGADKGAKEEIKQAIRRQIARSNEKLDDLLFKFLTHERAQILQTLI